VVGLGARLQRCVLHLDEVADTRTGPDVGPRPEARERADARALAQPGAGTTSDPRSPRRE
jgi:hypothetical protein